MPALFLMVVTEEDKDGEEQIVMSMKQYDQEFAEKIVKKYLKPHQTGYVYHQVAMYGGEDPAQTKFDIE